MCHEPLSFAFFHAALQFCNYQANLLRSLETGVRFRILHIRLKQNVFGTAGNKVMYLIRMCNIIQTKHEGVAIASLFQNNARISSHNEITYHGFIGFNLTNVWTSYTVPLYIKWNVSEWNSNEWLYVFRTIRIRDSNTRITILQCYRQLQRATPEFQAKWNLNLPESWTGTSHSMICIS